MNKFIIFTIGCLLAQVPILAQTPTYHNDLNWQLKWEDNFNSLDINKWSVKNNFDHYGESCVRIAQNVYLNNDTLILRARKQQYCCPQNSQYCQQQMETGDCYQYTGAWIETQPNYSVHFGYIEAKIKLTFRKGVGFSFWTFKKNSDSNPSEIDIFETMAVERQAINAISTCTHTCYTDNDPTCIKPSNQEHYLSNFDYTNWHTYAIEWDADRITWYIDSNTIRTILNRDLDNYGNRILDPIRVILGAHVNTDSIITTGSFQEYMYVDHVKVYQLICDKNTPINEISNFNTYNYAVKKYIRLSGATTIPQNSNISLRAAEYIELTNGFEVPLGVELYLDVNPCEMNNEVFTPGGGLQY